MTLAESCRLYRSSLRLILRPPIVVMFLLALAIVVSLSLVSRSYARDQLGVAENAVVLTCQELVDMGVAAADCQGIQATQAQSVASLQAIADEIGPEAATLATTRGGVAFAAGHGLSAVGVLATALALTTAYSAESRGGVARLRETIAPAFAINLSRVAAVLTAWLVWFAAAAVAVVTVGGRTYGELAAEYGPVEELTLFSSLLTRISVGLVGGLGVCCFVLALRRRITARPAVVALLTLGAGCGLYVVSSALPAVATPLGAMLNSQLLGQQYTFLDHLPFSLDRGTDSGVWAILVLAAWSVTALVALRISCRQATDLR